MVIEFESEDGLVLVDRKEPMSNPPPIAEVSLRINEALESIGNEKSLELLGRLGAETPNWLKNHLAMEHSYPSPSNITRCRYQLWLNAKDKPRDEEPPTLWKIRQLMGIIAEPLWLAVLGMAGFEVTLPNERLECGPNMFAYPDAVLDSDFLYEGKTINGWGYKRLLESSVGVSAEEDSHYTQAQLYLYAAKKMWCLYLATPPDPGFLQSTMRQKKRYGASYEMPPVYLEWIERDDATIEDALQRAEMIVEDSKSDEPPPREYDGRTVDLKGKKLMPCGFCLFSATCQTKYGYGEYEGDIEWA
ncbi:hypothetical protein LCGC14_1300920 [marine sediment metagenome]|uniref:PD-(D/E)XK endonuclease-like domain-containing protein n=1 Tax=marine sediment metagenome TaxID=412755 RepID=A0A0F9KQ36_9ZZZZ